MLSFGMLAAFAARMTVRRRGFPSGSPPPTRAATVISLISLVNTRPRLASAAPFLCLIVCNFTTNRLERELEAEPQGEPAQSNAAALDDVGVGRVVRPRIAERGPLAGGRVNRREGRAAGLLERGKRAELYLVLRTALRED